MATASLLALTGCGAKDDKAAATAPGISAGRPASAAKSVEQAKPTAAQQAIIDGGSETKWEAQGLTWKLPVGWPQMQASKESLNYGAPAHGFLIATISAMPAGFPAATSLDATHTGAVEQLKQGKYEVVRWIEIDGVKGVEWIEAMPEDKEGARRHQWIAFRNYQGQNQLLNIMVSTKGSNFDKQRDTFAAIMYSMKIPKG
jgi:hypothetical protein